MDGESIIIDDLLVFPWYQTCIAWMAAFRAKCITPSVDAFIFVVSNISTNYNAVKQIITVMQFLGDGWT